VTYRYAFHGNANASVIVLLDAALAFESRVDLIREVEHRSGLVLCGVDAPRCKGAPA
jgi:hypothetical protein